MADDFGDWKKTKAATIHVLGLVKDGIGAVQNGKIYGNSEHVAIIKVTITFADENGDELLSVKDINLPLLRKSVSIILFDNSEELIELGTVNTEAEGWNIVDGETCFTCIMPRDDIDEGEDPIFVDIKDMTDNVAAPTATLYYKVNYQKDNQKEDASVHLGLVVYPTYDDGDTPGIDPYYIAKVKDFRDLPNQGINLTAIPPIEFNENDFDWNGEFIDHPDGDDDTLLMGENKQAEGQYWREVSYRATLKLSEEEAGKDYYANKIFRISMKKNEVYGKKSNDFPDVSSDYTFGHVRNGFYHFRGYFWPYNLYLESDIKKPDASPLKSPPSGSKQDRDSYGKLYLYDNGFQPRAPTVEYNKNAAHISLLCTFGWTSNNEWWDNSLDLDIFDQYGNKGSVCVDQKLIPNKYDRTGNETSLDRRSYFSKIDTNAHGEDGRSENNKNVSIQLASTKNLTGSGTSQTYLYFGGKDDNDDLIPYLSLRPGALGTSNYYFRPFRQKSNTPVLHSLTYNINGFDLPLTALYFGVDWATTIDVMDIVDDAWCLLPIWSNNSMAIYSPTERAYLSEASDSSGGTGYRASMVLAGSTSTLEWVPIVITDPKYAKDPDKGETGYDGSILGLEGKNGRGYWVGVTSLRMLLEGAPNIETVGYIYPNGLNQAEVSVTFSMRDADGKPLLGNRRPTDSYLLNSITLTDYITTDHIAKEPDRNGWAFDTEANDFSVHTFGSASEFIQIDRGVVVRDSSVPDDSVTLKYYVTCSSGKAGLKRQIGLRLEITDPLWGDPFVYTCSSKGGDEGNNNNFQQSVLVETKNALEYTVKNVEFELASSDQGPHQDDWPISPDGDEPLSNMWRLLSYTPKISNGVYSAWIHKCAVDKGVFEEGAVNNAKCFSKKYSGVYSTEAWIWPTNIVGINGEEIKGSNSKGPFSLGNYGVTVTNDGVLPDDPNKIDDKPFFISVYYEFAGGDYGYIYKNEYINLILYDQYGNKGRFHLNPTFYPDNFDETKLDNLTILNAGWQTAKMAAEIHTAEWQVHCIDMNDEDRVAKAVGLDGWYDIDSYWTVHAGDLVRSRSLFQLRYEDGHYRFRHKGDTYLTYSKERVLVSEYDDGGDRFKLVLKPVWKERAFLIGTKADGACAFSYSFDTGKKQNCPYIPIAPNDNAFVWRLFPYFDD